MPKRPIKARPIISGPLMCSFVREDQAPVDRFRRSDLRLCRFDGYLRPRLRREGARPEPQRKAIKDDKDDPPCIRAKREYLAIVRGVGGQFICLGEGGQTEPLTLTIGEPKNPEKLLRPATAAAGAFTFPNRPWPPTSLGASPDVVHQRYSAVDA